jgi:hypothetical protein
MKEGRGRDDGKWGEGGKKGILIQNSIGGGRGGEANRHTMREQMHDMTMKNAWSCIRTTLHSN